MQGRVQLFSLTAPFLGWEPQIGPQVRCEMVEAGRGQPTRGAGNQRCPRHRGRGTLDQHKHILGSACRKDVRAGARIQLEFVLCVSEIIPQRSTGFHIFPHLFLICSLDRCQTTIPRMEKHKTKYKAFYLFWFCSEMFPAAWLCSCPRHMWRPKEEPQGRGGQGTECI